MRISRDSKRLLAMTAVSMLAASGCGAGLFNAAFLNTTVGGQFPVTPGPGAAFVLVRGLNETGQNVEFIITVERERLVLDENGDFQVDDDNNFITRPERETIRLLTGATGQGTDLGLIFDCGVEPVTFVGLGRNLLPTDVAVFVGGAGAGAATGVGVAAGALNPLSLAASNFNCGDTIIFRAFRSTGTPGGVRVESFLLPGSEQPSVFSGPNTFVNLEAFLEAQVREDEP